MWKVWAIFRLSSLNADFLLLLFECIVFCIEAHNISVRGALLVETEDQINQLEVGGPNWQVEIKNLIYKHGEKRPCLYVCLELHRSS